MNSKMILYKYVNIETLFKIMMTEHILVTKISNKNDKAEWQREIDEVIPEGNFNLVDEGDNPMALSEDGLRLIRTYIERAPIVSSSFSTVDPLKHPRSVVDYMFGVYGNFCIKFEVDVSSERWVKVVYSDDARTEKLFKNPVFVSNTDVSNRIIEIIDYDMSFETKLSKLHQDLSQMLVHGEKGGQISPVTILAKYSSIKNKTPWGIEEEWKFVTSLNNFNRFNYLDYAECPIDFSSMRIKPLCIYSERDFLISHIKPVDNKDKAMLYAIFCHYNKDYLKKAEDIVKEELDGNLIMPDSATSPGGLYGVPDMGIKRCPLVVNDDINREMLHGYLYNKK